MARIVVSGYMIRLPVPGNILAFFQHVLGLSRLGHEVIYVEEGGWPNSCFDPAALDVGDDPGFGIAAVKKLAADHGLNLPVYFASYPDQELHGGSWPELKRMFSAADLLLNIGGVCSLPELKLCRRRALVDLDPFFTQIGSFGGNLEDYHVHFSYGANIGNANCAVPTAGIRWIATAPPVAMDLWPMAETQPRAPFTTIANWNAYGSREWNGERYGQKDEEFLKFISLPRHTPQELELTLSGASEDIQQTLAREGWSLRAAGKGVGTEMAAYLDYISRSRGEFSVAKNAYVKTRSGWFSDRTVCYLASGLPAVLQDTGFSDYLPVGDGLLPFSSLDEAVDAIGRVNCDYARHRAAARDLANRFFNYEVVLPRLLAAALE